MKKQRKIKPVVAILDEQDEKADLKYWSGKTPEERIEAVFELREQYIRSLGYKKPPKIQAVVKIISP